MQSNNRILDDMARVASSAMGAAGGVRTELEALFRQRMQRLLDEMDLVSREEFEAVKAMAAKAREEQEKLEARVAALEARLAAPAPKRAAAKPKSAAAGPKPAARTRKSTSRGK